jgi:hypothetical protein
MAKILLYILLVLCFVVIIRELKELYQKDVEFEKSAGRDEIKQYIDKTFGNGNYKVFKSLLDGEGRLRNIIYLSQYEWFKTPTYQWYDVYATEKGYNHTMIEE